MWLFTKHGFYSVVKKKFGDQVKPFQVRGRSKGDLVNLIERCHLDEKVIHTPHADYHYRITVDGEELNRIFELMQKSLDYENFKSMIADQSGQSSKLVAYHEIWNSMNKFQGQDKPPLDMDEGENYYDEVDKIIGSPSTRSLRSLFDPYAHEWGDNDMKKKISILKQLLAVKSLPYWTNSYSDFYTNEANKPHVVDAIPDALEALYNNADNDLKKLMEPHLPTKPPAK